MSIFVMVAMAGFLFAAAPALAQTSEDIQNLDRFDRNFDKLLAFLNGCTSRFEMNDVSVVNDCMMILNQVSDELERILDENNELVNDIVFG